MNSKSIVINVITKWKFKCF